MTLAIVFGANGFIGTHVAAALRTGSNIEIVGAGIGRPSPGLEEDWLGVDLLSDDRLETHLLAFRPDVVVNCAGATEGATADLVRANVLTAARLVEAIARSGVGTRLVHIGSAAEYGSGPIGRPVDEATCPSPHSPYGIVKLAATQLVAASAAAGKDAVVLRVFNARGPGMPAESMPGAALQRLTDAVSCFTSRIEMGPLGAVRDFIDVRDVATAVVAACVADRLDAPIVNVGSGIGHSARELLLAMAERLGFAGEISEASAGSSRSSDVLWQVADVSLADRLLGWRPVHDLRSSVEYMTAGTGSGGPSHPIVP